MPKGVARRAHGIMHLLMAGMSLQDVAVIGRIVRWRSTNRLGLKADGKWFVTFVWEELVGAKDIRLERR